jgi:hypothetical protein
MCRLFILGHGLEPMLVLIDERHDAGDPGGKEQDGNRVADMWNSPHQ